MASARCSCAVPQFGLNAFDVGQMLHVPTWRLYAFLPGACFHTSEVRRFERFEGVEIGDE